MLKEGSVTFNIELLPIQQIRVLYLFYRLTRVGIDTLYDDVKNLSPQDFLSSLKLLRFEQTSNYEGSTHSCRW